MVTSTKRFQGTGATGHSGHHAPRNVLVEHVTGSGNVITLLQAREANIVKEKGKLWKLVMRKHANLVGGNLIRKHHKTIVLC